MGIWEELQVAVFGYYEFTTSVTVTDYRTLHITLFTSVSTTLVYLVYLILPCFDYILVSPFILFLIPSSCIYRRFGATFTIKSLVQFLHTAKLTVTSAGVFL